MFEAGLASLWPVRRPVWVLALIVAAALGLRLGYVAIAPERHARA